MLNMNVILEKLMFTKMNECESVANEHSEERQLQFAFVVVVFVFLSCKKVVLLENFKILFFLLMTSLSVQFQKTSLSPTKDNRNSGGKESKRSQFLRELGGCLQCFFVVFFSGEKYKYQDINIKIYVSFSVEQAIRYFTVTGLQNRYYCLH